MEYIIYVNNLNKTALQGMNIVIDSSTVAEGVKIYPNVSIVNSSIGLGSEIHSNSVIENSCIGENNIIKASYIENSSVKNNCDIGPFAHIRQNSDIHSYCRIGNFVEIKKSKIGDGCKIAHLSYVGDATLGQGCNIGCGVVFCNYNGKIKQNCILGNNVFVGSNVNLVAPLSVGDNSFIAAGSTINKDIYNNQFAIARAKQEIKKLREE